MSNSFFVEERSKISVLKRYNNAVLKIESLKFHKVAAHSAPATSLRAAGGGNLEPIFCRSRKEHLLILLVVQCGIDRVHHV